MKKLHSYVPAKVRTAEVCIPSTGNIEEIKQFSCLKIFFGGDQLTCARARGIEKAMIEECDPELRFDGLIPVAEDRHIKFAF